MVVQFVVYKKNVRPYEGAGGAFGGGTEVYGGPGGNENVYGVSGGAYAGGEKDVKAYGGVGGAY